METDETDPRVKLPIVLDEIKIRLADDHDAAAVCALFEIPEVARYQLFDADQFRSMFAQSMNYGLGAPGITSFFAIDHKADRILIGEAQLNIENPESRQAEFGIALHPDYWGRGFATLTLRSVLDVGFDKLGLHRIYAGTDTRNERCWRLLERVGMRREAHFRHEYFVKGEWVDSYVYAILEDEWRAR